MRSIFKFIDKEAEEAVKSIEARYKEMIDRLKPAEQDWTEFQIEQADKIAEIETQKQEEIIRVMEVANSRRSQIQQQYAGEIGKLRGLARDVADNIEQVFGALGIGMRETNPELKQMYDRLQGLLQTLRGIANFKEQMKLEKQVLDFIGEADPALLSVGLRELEQAAADARIAISKMVKITPKERKALFAKVDRNELKTADKLYRDWARSIEVLQITTPWQQAMFEIKVLEEETRRATENIKQNYKDMIDRMRPAWQDELEFRIANEKQIAEITKAAQEDTTAVINAETEKRRQILEQFASDSMKSIARSAREIGRILGSETNEATEMVSDVFENLGSFVEAIATQNIPAAMAVFADTLTKIFQFVADRHKRLRERAEEELKRIRELARDTGEEIGQSITDGLDVDFEVLIEQFVKAQLAQNIAKIFVEQFAPQFDLLSKALTQVGDFGDILNAETIEKQANQYLATISTAGIPGLKRIIEKYEPKEVQELFADLTRDGRITEEEAKKLAEQSIRFRYGLIDINQVFSDMKTDFDEMEPRFQDMVGTAEKVFDGFGEGLDDLSDQMPHATFRAVTEPQANQMLAIMGSQLDYQAQIAMNTARMVEILGGGGLPVGGVPIAAPQLMPTGQNVSGKLQFEVLVNGQFAGTGNKQMSIQELVTQITPPVAREMLRMAESLEAGYGVS